MNKNIVLAGFGGSGKTTVGRYLAHRFDKQFKDVDEEISKRLGYHHDQLIQQEGWEAFRVLEREIVKDLSNLENIVIATGGGTLLDTANIVDFKKNGVIFYIDVPFEELKRRTRSRLDRPVANAWTDEEIRRKYQERLPNYLSADVHVPVNGCNPEECADILIDAVFKQGFQRIPYELWFRKVYKPLIESKQLTTIIRPGVRIRPEPKGTFPGEIARVRILVEPGTQNSLPRFDDYATTVTIKEIKIKNLGEVTSQDLIGSSPETATPEAVKYHLGLIYNRILRENDKISLLYLQYEPRT
ncbi:shikimate kinase [Candidatus Woesearchaeota archaeon]|nr:shikimate kinase [Candidatus Woesearchaeota archaeon]